MTRRPAGARILLLRSEDRATPLLARLRRAGHEPCARPVIDVAPPRDPAPASAAVRAIERYDLLVFTSANGVRAFEELRRASGTTGELPGVAAIGPATAAALRDAGIEPELVADDARGEGLAARLAPRVANGQRVLVVRPEVARDVVQRALRSRGAQVDDPAFYRNVAAPDVGETARSFAADGWDVTVFFAPSNVQRLCAGLERVGVDAAAALASARVVAIGVVTARALRSAGATRVVVASAPTDAALTDAVAAALVLPSSAVRRPG